MISNLGPKSQSPKATDDYNWEEILEPENDSDYDAEELSFQKHIYLQGQTMKPCICENSECQSTTVQVLHFKYLTQFSQMSLYPLKKNQKSCVFLEHLAMIRKAENNLSTHKASAQNTL